MVKDPVCGMEIDPAKAAQTREAMGQTFYFCSNFCAELFNPEMTETDLSKLRAAIGGKGHPSGQGRIGEAINKLIGLLFRR